MGIFGFGKKIDYEDFEDDEDELEYEDDDASLSLGGSNIELKVIKPTQFNQILTAGDHLIEGKAVLLNLEGLDKALTRRVVDFLSGSVYALDGSVKKIAQSTYLFCPHNMDVVGDLETASVEIESYI